METLHVQYVKFVAAGGDLDAASERKVSQDTVTVKRTGNVVEKMTSQSKNPNTIYELGTGYEMKFVLESATLDDDVSVHGGTHAGSIFTKDQTARTLAKYDIRVGVIRPSGKVVVPHDYTDMYLTPDTENSYENGKVSMMPVTAKASDTSDETIDNSVT